MKQLLIFALFLSSCVINDPTMVVLRQGRYFNQNNLNSIVVGKTTIKTVLDRLGRPYQKAVINGRRAFVYKTKFILKKSEETNKLSGSDSPTRIPKDLFLNGFGETRERKVIIYYENNLVSKIESEHL